MIDVPTGILDALRSLGAAPSFDGPEERCPICHGSISQLALVLEMEVGEPLDCGGCGAVLAA
jgi:hypothetical protein